MNSELLEVSTETRVHVSITRKRSIEVGGAWESEEVCLSQSVSLGEGDDADAVRGDLLETLEAAATIHLDAYLPMTINPARANQQTIDEYAQDVESDGRSQLPPPPRAANNGPRPILAPEMQLQWGPKAADRRPGQWWQVVCGKYKYEVGPDGESIEFWNADRQYPEAFISSGSPAWPATWIEKLDAGGPWDFGKPVLVTCRISENTSKKTGNHYVDVVALEVVKVS